MRSVYNFCCFEAANARATTFVTTMRWVTTLDDQNLALNKHFFRFSATTNTKRSIYAKLFIVLRCNVYTINEAKTKAMYLATHGLTT